MEKGFFKRDPRMCEKCVELDEKIDHYERLSSMITDEQTLRALKQAISRMEAEKAALHPEQGR
jgi:predicted  nucleic acid-binding Zn-ribbon protein